MRSTTFMQIAFMVSQESKCCSWKVGSVIEKNGKLISSGCNGTPAGLPNCCDVAIDKGWGVQTPKGHIDLRSDKTRMEHSAWSKMNEIHSEMNSIMNAGVPLHGATMYVTLSPCSDCAKNIAQSGIKTLVYCEEYDQNGSGWADILVNAGVKVYKLDKSKLKQIRWEEFKLEPSFIKE